MRNKLKRTFRNQAGFGRLGIVITLVIIVAALAVFFILHPWKKEPIKIGAILSLSGPGGFYGEEARDGMLLAVDEINAWGGINGRKIELIIEDSKTNPEEGKEGFKRIEEAHGPVLYFSTLSSVSMVLAPLAKQSKVVLVGLIVATPKLTKQNEWVFRYWITSREEIPPALSTLKALEVKDLGILYLNDEYGISVFQLLKKGFEKTGGAVRAEAFDVKRSDFKVQIGKLIDTEAIYCIGFDSHLRNVFKQLKKENFKGHIVSTNAPAQPLLSRLPESSGVYVSAPTVYNPKYLFAKEFMEKYGSRYNKPFNHYAANGYDMLKLLAGLLEDKEISRQSVRNLLEEGFIYSGVFGTLDIKPGERDLNFPLYPAQIVDGRVKYLR